MLLLILVLISSLGGAVLAWFLASWWLPEPDWVPLVSGLVALAIALAWANGFQALERAYLAARFAPVRRWIGLWASSMGTVETVLTRLHMEVEAEDAVAFEEAMAAAPEVGVQDFARYWAEGKRLRMNGAHAQAVRAFESGMERLEGLDRAELALESAVLLIQFRGGHQASQQRAVRYLNEAGAIVRDVGANFANRGRVRYLELLGRLARAMLYARQGRVQDSAERFDEVERRASLQHSLRGRRLTHASRVERLALYFPPGGKGAFEERFQEVELAVSLPELRLRLKEIRREREVAEARLEAEEARRTESPGSSEEEGDPSAPLDDEEADLSDEEEEEGVLATDADDISVDEDDDEVISLRFDPLGEDGPRRDSEA